MMTAAQASHRPPHDKPDQPAGEAEEKQQQQPAQHPSQ
jgi:hypothetical protein